MGLGISINITVTVRLRVSVLYQCECITITISISVCHLSETVKHQVRQFELHLLLVLLSPEGEEKLYSHTFRSQEFTSVLYTNYFLKEKYNCKNRYWCYQTIVKEVHVSHLSD